MKSPTAAAGSGSLLPGFASTLTCALAGAVTLYPAPAAAHHGAAAYDRATRVAVDGIVQRFTWGNPHALIELVAVDAEGRTERWTAETAGLVILVRAGWNKEALVPGEHCTLIGFPARNGSPTMILERFVCADGRALTNFVP